MMASGGDVEEDKREDATTSDNEEREEESKDERVQRKQKATDRVMFDGEERKVERRKKNKEKYKKRKKDKRDHMMVCGDKETKVKKKKKIEKDNKERMRNDKDVVLAGHEEHNKPEDKKENKKEYIEGGSGYFDGEERKVEKRKKNKEKDDVLVVHETGREVKKRKKEKRDHMKLLGDKETKVDKKNENYSVVVAGIERQKVRSHKEMKRDDMKAQNKVKKKKRKRKETEDGVVAGKVIVDIQSGNGAENVEATLDAREKVNLDKADCEVPKSAKRARATDSSNPVIPESISGKVRSSDEVKAFPPSDSSNESVDGLVQGKRYSKEEDELIKKAVSDYIVANRLGEEGLNMVLNCISHPHLKGCWKEISAALPWRPNSSIYKRARRLYTRGESKWTSEEVEHMRKSYTKHGPNWKRMADELGKNYDQVRHAFQRYQLGNLNKGKWFQHEYQTLFELVNKDLMMNVLVEKKSKHGMLKDNIRWEAISWKLGTRNVTTCCKKWYNQLTSPMAAEGIWADVDDYRLMMVLVDLDASCEDEVEWDYLLEDRSGEVCRKRWLQMMRHLGEHGNKSFSEQVEVLSKRYCPDMAEVREALDARPVVD